MCTVHDFFLKTVMSGLSPFSAFHQHLNLGQGDLHQLEWTLVEKLGLNSPWPSSMEVRTLHSHFQTMVGLTYRCAVRRQTHILGICCGVKTVSSDSVEWTALRSSGLYNWGFRGPNQILPELTTASDISVWKLSLQRTIMSTQVLVWSVKFHVCKNLSFLCREKTDLKRWFFPQCHWFHHRSPGHQ